MINYALIGRALLHPVQEAILKAFDRPGVSTLSPNQLANLIDIPLGNISYHVGMLAGTRGKSRFADSPVLELVRTEPRRGAVEHFYRLTDSAKLGSLDAAEGEGRR